MKQLDRAEFGGATREVGGHVEVYHDRSDDWRWSRVTDNGHIVADSSEGYRNRIECVEMAMRLFPTVHVYEVEAR